MPRQENLSTLPALTVRHLDGSITHWPESARNIILGLRAAQLMNPVPGACQHNDVREEACPRCPCVARQVCCACEAQTRSCLTWVDCACKTRFREQCPGCSLIASAFGECTCPQIERLTAQAAEARLGLLDASSSSLGQQALRVTFCPTSRVITLTVPANATLGDARLLLKEHADLPFTSYRWGHLSDNCSVSSLRPPGGHAQVTAVGDYAAGHQWTCQRCTWVNYCALPTSCHPDDTSTVIHKGLAHVCRGCYLPGGDVPYGQPLSQIPEPLDPRAWFRFQIPEPLDPGAIRRAHERMEELIRRVRERRAKRLAADGPQCASVGSTSADIYVGETSMW